MLNTRLESEHKNNAKRLVAHESPQPAISSGGGRAACVLLGLATDAALHTSELYALAGGL